MEAASDFISKNLRVMLLPVLAYCFSMAFFVLWMFAAVHVYSVGTSEYKKNSFIANIKWAPETEYIMWGFLFGLFWCVAFLICLQ